jgi:hypothetical protein
MRSYASFLEKKEVKKTSPWMVVMDIELSKTMALKRFSIFLISFFGICMKVYPKNTLLGLNLEWKHKRLFVMYSLPCRMILSLSPQEKLLYIFSSDRREILDIRNYSYLLESALLSDLSIFYAATGAYLLPLLSF